MKPYLYLTLLLFHLGCPGQSDNNEAPVSTRKETDRRDGKNPIGSLRALSSIKHPANYESVKKSIKEKRQRWSTQALPVDSLSRLFRVSLLNEIIPFWEETRWSFEGHTAQPGSGTIACGYFVSTTLQDIGLNVNRYALAQQSPENEAKSLAIAREVKEFSAGSVAENIAAINEYLKEGIHFIGFDGSHVGYILKEQNGLYLIHSNYLNAAGVEIEPVGQSEVFRSYSRYYIVELSTNESLLHCWIKNKAIQIMKM